VYSSIIVCSYLYYRWWVSDQEFVIIKDWNIVINFIHLWCFQITLI